MYLPKVFSNENQDHILKIIDEYPFMTLITGAEISHIPLVAQIDEPLAKWMEDISLLQAAIP